MARTGRKNRALRLNEMDILLAAIIPDSKEKNLLENGEWNKSKDDSDNKARFGCSEKVRFVDASRQ